MLGLQIHDAHGTIVTWALGHYDDDDYVYDYLFIAITIIIVVVAVVIRLFESLPSIL